MYLIITPIVPKFRETGSVAKKQTDRLKNVRIFVIIVQPQIVV